MNKNRIKNIVIIILSLIIVFLLSFIICNKFIEKNQNDTSNDDMNNGIKDNTSNNDMNNEFKDDTSNNDISIDTNQNPNVITSIEQFPTENTDEILLYGEIFNDLLDEEQKKKVDVGKNFETVTFNINNIPITYSCTTYEENKHLPEISRCAEINISFGNHNLVMFNSLGSGRSDVIIYTENYLIHRVIHGDTDLGNIYVYDKNHNLLTAIDNVHYYYHDSNNKTVFNSFRLVDNILYFITVVWNDGFVWNNGFPYIKYLSYVDLNDSTYTVHNIEKLN